MKSTLLLGVILVTCNCIFGKIKSDFDLRLKDTSELFVDWQYGNDSKQCGSKVSPCKSLECAWSHLTKLSNSRIEIVIKPGKYGQKTDPPLFLSCINSNLDVTVTGEHVSKNVTNAPDVLLSHSFHLDQCAFTLRNIIIVDATESFFHGSKIFLSDVVFWNATVDLKFYQCEMVNLMNSQFQNVTSFSEVLEVNECLYFIVQNCLIYGSIAKRYFAIQAFYVTISSLIMRNNEGYFFSKSLHFQDINAFAANDVLLKANRNVTVHLELVTAIIKNVTLDSNFISYGNNSFEERNFLVAEASVVTVQKSTFSCNQYGSATYGSPIHYDTESTVTCIQCSYGKCLFNCSAGHEIKQEVLCIKCEPGTFASDRERQCRECRKGHFSKEYGSSKCQTCKAGTFCSEKGCTKCEDCGNDFLSSFPAASGCWKVTTLTIILIAVFVFMFACAVVVVCMKRCCPWESEDNLKSFRKLHRQYEISAGSTEEEPDTSSLGGRGNYDSVSINSDFSRK